MQHSRKIILAGALALGTAGTFCYAQEVPGPPGDRLYFRQAVPAQAGAIMMQGGAVGVAGIQYVASEMSFDGKVVKGAPYSAQAVTETTQTLADGNRIHRTVTAGVYRDSEGRTRREQSLGGIGPFGPPGDAPQTIFINDPVSGNNYLLEPGNKIARKMPAPPSADQMAKLIAERKAGGITTAGEPRSVMMLNKVEAEKGAVRMGVFTAGVPGPGALKMPQSHTEPLGTQTIEGVQAEGTRTTMTIAAGEIGNDRPIEVVSERWYSQELQTVMMTRHSDPRVGETVYRLTNLNRSEPSLTLFQVPADYTVEEGPAMLQMRMSKPGENK